MGSCFNERVWEGTLTDTQLAERYRELVDAHRIEYGTDAYNGSFSTLPHVQIHKQEFGSQNEARDYACNKSSKWDHAVAVKFREVVENPVKFPTFNGKTLKENTLHTVVLGGNTELDQPRDVYYCRAVVKEYNHATRLGTTTVTADQLTGSQKAKLVKLYNEWSARHDTHQKIATELVALCERIKQVRQTVEAADFARLKKLHAQRKKAWVALSKASVKLRDLDLRLSAGLYKTEKVYNGLKWFVGGWCAE